MNEQSGVSMWIIKGSKNSSESTADGLLSEWVWYADSIETAKKEAMQNGIEVSEIAIGSLDTAMKELHVATTMYNEQSKLADEAKKQKNLITNIVISLLDEAGIRKAGNNEINISLNDEIVPTVENWEAVYNYIEQNQAWHLLQKRMAAGSYREICNLGENIPGTKPFTKQKLSVRVV